MAVKQITEHKIREIAREEAAKIQTQLLKEIEVIKNATVENKQTLERLERLLLGEFGMDSEATLKSKAEFSYKVSKECVDKKLIVRSESALKWFEDWDNIGKGCNESKISILGKIINGYSAIKWLIGFWAFTTSVALIPALKMIIDWINNLGS